MMAGNSSKLSRLEHLAFKLKQSLDDCYLELDQKKKMYYDVLRWIKQEKKNN